MSDIRAEKTAVIREGLVVLTGDAYAAVVLNQLIYWTQHCNTASKFLKEEIDRAELGLDVGVSLLSGWIYKTAEDLTEEVMLKIHRTTMRTILKSLVENGWLHQRTNPAVKWDRTLQYRVDLIKIRDDLNILGYHLSGYPLANALSGRRHSNVGIADAPSDNARSEKRHWNVAESSNIPETTTEITNIISKEDIIFKRARGKSVDKSTLETLCIEDIQDWLIEKRQRGQYLNVDESLVLERFKDYCYSKGKTYKDYKAALRNSFAWESNKQPMQTVSKGEQYANDLRNTIEGGIADYEAGVLRRQQLAMQSGGN